MEDTRISTFVAGAVGVAVGAALAAVIGMATSSTSSSSGSRTGVIRRWGTSSARASAAVAHNGVVHLSGQVGIIDRLGESTIEEQTRETLDKIDALLAKAGTSKKYILSSQIWLKDIKRDFNAMNVVWNQYVAEFPDHKGVRACVEAEMARPTLLVEIKVIAAIP